MKKPFKAGDLININKAYFQKSMKAILKFCGKVEVSASENIIQTKNKNVQNSLKVKGFFRSEPQTWILCGGSRSVEGAV
jgi:hypothetical protein